jgi:shikimate dehydrogenase
MKKFAVLGNPIDHSLSPQIHLEFARQLNISLSYVKKTVPLDSFEKTISELKNDKFYGANVTLPFKSHAAKIAQHKSSEVIDTHSANTLTFLDGYIEADSTDGMGLLNDLENKIGSIANTKILLLGAGGAANAVIPGLHKNQICQLFMWNRTIQKSHDMQLFWSKKYNHLAVMENIDLTDIDLIINATSAGVDSQVSPIQINTTNKDLVCYDMMYGQKTPFLQQAEKSNLTHFDGLGMLVQQAALSFEIWHQMKVDTNKIEADLRLTI